MSQGQDTPQIQIIVQGPDDRSDTSSTVSGRVLRRKPSSDRTRLDPPLASSTSCVSLSRLSGAPLTEGTTIGSSSSSSQNSSHESLKSGDFGIATPIPASEVKRNDRNRIIPKLKHKRVQIDPVKTEFDHAPRDDKWEPHVHPDGALYFFDPIRRIYTDADLSIEKELQIVNHHAEQLVERGNRTQGFPWDTCELVLERIEGIGCGYYFVEPKKRCIFWLETVPSDMVARDLARVQSFAHIKYAMEAEFWVHCMHFPNKWAVTPEVVAELGQMVLHAVSDSVASTTSVIPFDQDELAKILDLTDRLKDAVKELKFPHASCVVARFMQDFASAKFFNFCGQPGARLNSDQSIFTKSSLRRSLFIRLLSLCLFWAPCDYAKELDGIWVDKVINRILWKQFIAKLTNDWSGLALYATVILNANVAFLGLAGNAAAKSCSFVSTVTSVGVVVIALILVRQTQRKDQDSAEQANNFLGRFSHPVFGTEALAIMFSLPYALLMWSMVWFVAAFACMVFGSGESKLITKSTFGIAGGFVIAFVLGTVWTTRVTEE